MQQKKIGIWGYGSVGNAVHAYAMHKNLAVHIMDRKYTEKRCSQNVYWWPEEEHEDFFKTVDFFIPSPGIDITKFKDAFDPEE